MSNKNFVALSKENCNHCNNIITYQMKILLTYQMKILLIDQKKIVNLSNRFC